MTWAERILELLRPCQAGLTSPEMSVHLCGAPKRVTHLLSDMERRGLVRRIGTRPVPGQRGPAPYVWAAA